MISGFAAARSGNCASSAFAMRACSGLALLAHHDVVRGIADQHVAEAEAGLVGVCCLGGARPTPSRRAARARARPPGRATGDLDSSSCVNSRPMAAATSAISRASPSRSSRATSDACSATGTLARAGDLVSRFGAGAALHDRARHFLEEQRHAVGARDDVVDGGARQRARPGDPAHQLALSVGAQLAAARSA